MRHYFLTAREIARLTRILEPAILRSALGPPAIEAETDNALLRAGFVLAEGKLLPIAGPRFRREPIQMLRILQVARDRGLELHPLAIRSLHPQRAPRRFAARRPEGGGDLHGPAVRQGADASTGRSHPDGARWLAILNETGFFGRYLPDWARIVGQMQFDTYHIFTVDEHTIEAVRILNALETRRACRSRADRLAAGRSSAIAPRAVSGDAAARHRQGPRRRSFGAGRRNGACRSARARSDRRRDRDGILAGAASSAAERRRHSSATSTIRRRFSIWPTRSSRPSACGCC